MPFAIKDGLFKLNIVDHHAILGVSLDAEPKQIRLRYLKIAQKLHPDKCRSDLVRKKRAGQILSKLVNPAYEQLSRKTSCAEHQLVLVQIGKHLAENQEKVEVKHELAQELLKAGGSVELVYPKLLNKLIVEQYQDFEQLGQIIESISELNLVYLMLKGDRGINRPPSQALVTKNSQPKTEAQAKTAESQAKASAANPSVAPEEPTTESRVTAFVNRAQQYIAKGEYDRAITELKDALRIDPHHGVAHAVMGKAYLHKKQVTMAKVHIGKAVKADPHHKVVLESKKALDRIISMTKKSKTSNPDSTGKSNGKNNKSTNSGFFSGLFGAKKK